MYLELRYKVFWVSKCILAASTMQRQPFLPGKDDSVDGDSSPQLEKTAKPKVLKAQKFWRGVPITGLKQTSMNEIRTETPIPVKRRTETSGFLPVSL